MKSKNTTKKKGKQGNPNPIRTKEFYEKQFKPIAPTTEKLGDKPFGVRLPVDVTEKLKEMPQAERIAFMRKVLTEAVRSDDMCLSQ